MMQDWKGDKTAKLLNLKINYYFLVFSKPFPYTAAQLSQYNGQKNLDWFLGVRYGFAVQKKPLQLLSLSLVAHKVLHSVWIGFSRKSTRKWKYELFFNYSNSILVKSTDIS